MKKDRGHLIKEVLDGSIAKELEIGPGDRLLAINNNEIEDIFDYQFLAEDTYLEMLIQKPDGQEWLLEIEKDEDEDIGILFANGLMDEYRSCRNKCIFCFIDQMPKGMRETLYFKDDDARLSFLQGNYITLTNLSEQDIDRIIRYRLSPINISFHTMNPALRCRMLNNRFAGEALQKADKLFAAGIRMNGQIVLCKGINDGEELRFSLRELMKYLPYLESVSIVPVGLTKYREGLYPLEPFTGEDAGEVLDIIRECQKKALAECGLHFAHASDEWYILAGQSLPEADCYDGYLQLENGVGMLRLLLDEFAEALQSRDEAGKWPAVSSPVTISLATGLLAGDYLKDLTEQIMERIPGLTILVYPVRNDFFGERITVSGLLTGRDLLAQLKEKELGSCLLLPQNLLRSGEDIFLDDLTVSELENALQVKIDIVKSSGYELIEAVIKNMD